MENHRGCVHNYFEKQARLQPNNIAVKYNDASLTYCELNRYANVMAKRIIENKVNIEDFVIVYMDRRIELMISIFGILKAGGVYVPISGDYPKSRLLSVIEDTQPKLVITEKKYSHQIPEHLNQIIVDDFLIDNEKTSPILPEINVHPNNLAYAIFTSGSTGKPKGVLIEHHSVVNRIEWMQKEYPIETSDTLIQKTSITFDVSIWELFWWSFVGAKLVLLPNDHEKSPEKLFECVTKEGVSIIHFVPSMFNVSLEYLKSVYPNNHTNKLKWIFCSGEELLPVSVTKFYELSSQSLKNKTQLVNLYGPTEATVDVTYYTCSKDVPAVIPIGKPIDNTQIYIIDENNQILPPNTEGELVICGVNLARGYLNRPELTDEKFIYIDIEGHRVRAYKSGDKAFIDNNNDIIYKGRIDQQVKIRGFRIELGEIESCALQMNHIKECSCIVEEAGTINAQIICFYISDSESTDTHYFKEHFKERLPEYMIPSQFVKLQEFPRTISGKIDKKELSNKKKQLELEPQAEMNNSKSNIEEQVENLWKGLLKRDKVNPTANFFDQGGNSLLLVQLSLLIKQNLNMDIDVLTIFQHPTIKSMVDYLNSKK